MILVPRGEGAEAKAIGGEKTQSVPKAKRKSHSLSEYLSNFAQLLRSFPSSTLPASYIKDTHAYPHADKRISSQLTSKTSQTFTKEKLHSIQGDGTQGPVKARSFHGEKGQIELTQIKSSSFLKSNDRITGRASGEITVKGVRKEKTGRKQDDVGSMVERSGRDGAPGRITIPMAREVGNHPISQRSSLRGNEHGSKKSLDREGIQGKEKTENFERVKNLQTIQGEGKSYLEGEKKGETKLPVLELRVDLSADYQKMLEQGSTKTGTSGIERETVLQQLHEKANTQIVQQAQLFLKDREDGEIRLILKPEQLGEVRIRLHVQDRLIEGHITVENFTVKELFEQNRGELAQAFREQGFEMSQLEVSVGRDSHHRETEQEPAQFHQVKAMMIAEQIPSVDRGWMEVHRLVDYYA